MGKIRSIYDKHDYLPQMRAAMATWATARDRIIAGRQWKGRSNEKAVVWLTWVSEASPLSQGGLGTTNSVAGDFGESTLKNHDP